jgi:hypothetical protein
MAPDGYDTKAWDNLTLHAVLSLITCEGMSSA